MGEQTPSVVPFDAELGSHNHVLTTGVAVGPVESIEWKVNPSDDPDLTLTFESEEIARAYWHDHGGVLDRVVTTSWALAKHWRTYRADQ